MNCTKLAPGEYRVESLVGTFIIRKLLNVANDDYQWGIFTEEHKKLELSWTKRDCEGVIGSWEEGTPVPVGEDYNLEYPAYIGSKRVDLFSYRMNTPEGVFTIRKLPGRKTGEFCWGIFSIQNELVAEHFSRGECEALVRDWASVALRHSEGGVLRTKPLRHRAESAENWRNDRATEAQKNVLRSKGVRVLAGLTKGDASDQIDLLLNRITAGQKRRLDFYQLPSAGVTKEQAGDLIDRYAREHPEAEQQYQHWKAEELRRHPPVSMNRQEWENTLEDIEKQSVAGGMILPASRPGDEAASTKQLEYIRSLVREIDEAQLKALTKTQACAVIEEIVKQRSHRGQS